MLTNHYYLFQDFTGNQNKDEIKQWNKVYNMYFVSYLYNLHNLCYIHIWCGVYHCCPEYWGNIMNILSNVTLYKYSTPEVAVKYLRGRMVFQGWYILFLERICEEKINYYTVDSKLSLQNVVADFEILVIFIHYTFPSKHKSWKWLYKFWGGNIINFLVKFNCK